MTHYSVQAWVDYVRNLVKPEDEISMRGHLSDCADCRQTLAALAEAQAVVSGDAAAPVPADWTARAALLFDLPRQSPSSGWMDGLRKLTAHLVFDNSAEMLPVGVRTTAALPHVPRKLSYRAGDYDLDLRVEPTGAGSSEIVGQILNRRNRADRVSGASIRVVARGKTLGETETNAFGEFVLEKPVKLAAKLSIGIRQAGCRIELSLQPAKGSKSANQTKAWGKETK